MICFNIIKFLFKQIYNCLFLYLIRRLLRGCLHVVPFLSADPLVVEGHPAPAAPLQVSKAAVPRHLAANAKVSVQRPDRVRHPAAVGVVHGLRHGGVPAHGGVRPVDARHQVSCHTPALNNI